MVTVIACRHGETAWSLSGQHTGRTDLELTEHGRRQAGLLGQRLRTEQIDAAYVSPMRRARETAALAGWRDAVVNEALVEWNYGDYEGLTTDEIRTVNPGWDLFRDGAPGGEVADEVGRRADEFIELVRERPGTVLVISHGHFLRVFAARWVGLAARHGEVFGPMAAAALSVLGSERDAAVAKVWNDTSALSAER